MDENRILDKLDRIAEDLSASRSDIKNLHQYIEAVNDNGKDTAKQLKLHELSEEVHGLGTGRRFTDALIKWVTVGLAFLGFILGVKREVKGTNSSSSPPEVRP